jgi:hypothetical protein
MRLGGGAVHPMEQRMLCRLFEIGCGSTTPVIEFAAIAIGVAIIITFALR